MTFRKYDHLERLGHSDVASILQGEVYVFPKLDGSNASVFNRSLDPDKFELGTGSRQREITPDDDNAGFAKWVRSDDPKAVMLRDIAEHNRGFVFYGEWMVPHTIKNYRPEVWRRFWIFDVYDRAAGSYLSFDDYAPALAGLDVVQPICTIGYPKAEYLADIAQRDNPLFMTEGPGEGIVVKNYTWRNAHGRQPWAKVVRAAFKEASKKPKVSCADDVEQAIVQEYVTAHLVDKTHAKVLLEVAREMGVDITCDVTWQQRVNAEYRSKVIPQLLQRVFYDLIVEESWEFVKKIMKAPNSSINYKVLQSRTMARVKELTPELF